MAVNPSPFTQTRELAATSPLEVGTAGKRVVAAAGSSKRIADQEKRDSRRDEDAAEQPPPRDERERVAQRQALSRLILGAFDELIDAPPARAREAEAADWQDATGQESKPPPRHPELEAAVLEFMYALFHALDQIDDAEAVLEVVTRPQGLGLGGCRGGRSVFGERLDLLARRVASVPLELLPKEAGVMEGLEGVAPRLARGYLAVLSLMQGTHRVERPGSSPRAQLAALLLRLANALHIAPASGYGSLSATGAMLRVRA